MVRARREIKREILYSVPKDVEFNYVISANFQISMRVSAKTPTIWVPDTLPPGTFGQRR
jgi:hypothetical protein